MPKKREEGELEEGESGREGKKKKKKEKWKGEYKETSYEMREGRSALIYLAKI